MTVLPNTGLMQDVIYMVQEFLANGDLYRALEKDAHGMRHLSWYHRQAAHLLPGLATLHYRTGMAHISFIMLPAYPCDHVKDNVDINFKQDHQVNRTNLQHIIWHCTDCAVFCLM